MRADVRMASWLSSIGADDRVRSVPSHGRGPVRLGEAGSGTTTNRTRNEGRKLFAILPCEPVPPGAADRYASVKISQQRRGLPLDENDLWIAATALLMGQRLLAATATSKESKASHWLSRRPNLENRGMKVLHNGNVMALSIDMPEDVRSVLEGRWGNLSRRLTENLALDGYRQGLLSLAQVRRLLGLATRWEAQEFLGSHGIPVFDFDPAELDREAALQKLADANRQSKRG